MISAAQQSDSEIERLVEINSYIYNQDTIVFNKKKRTFLGVEKHQKMIHRGVDMA